MTSISISPDAILPMMRPTLAVPALLAVDRLAGVRRPTATGAQRFAPSLAVLITVGQAQRGDLATPLATRRGRKPTGQLDGGLLEDARLPAR